MSLQLVPEPLTDEDAAAYLLHAFDQVLTHFYNQSSEAIDALDELIVLLTVHGGDHDTIPARFAQMPDDVKFEAFTHLKVMAGWENPPPDIA